MYYYYKCIIVDLYTEFCKRFPIIEIVIGYIILVATLEFR